MKLVKDTHPAVHILKEFCLFYNERNLDPLLNLFSKAEETFMWGTGVDEFHKGLEAMKNQILRDWKQSEKCKIEFTANSFTYSQNPNWASGDFQVRVTINGKNFTHPHLRASIYIIKEDDEWKICHMHCSFPESTQAVGNSFPMRD